MIDLRLKGCYVTGLYLEGARWDVDGQCLAECMSRSKYEKLPILAIIPAEICRLKLPKNWIAVPVYETSKRGELTDDNSCVFEATLNTSVHESFWILRGVCVVMNFEWYFASIVLKYRLTAIQHGRAEA